MSIGPELPIEVNKSQPLSPRERQVLAGTLVGLSRQAIATHCGARPATVRNTLTCVSAKILADQDRVCGDSLSAANLIFRPNWPELINRLPRLTQREDEYLLPLLHGQTDKQVAETLSVSPATVRNTITRITQRFGLKNGTRGILRYLAQTYPDFFMSLGPEMRPLLASSVN